MSGQHWRFPNQLSFVIFAKRKKISIFGDYERKIVTRRYRHTIDFSS